MSLRVIYGRVGCGKSRFCLDDIKNRLDKGGENPLILLVPEQYSLQAEKNLVETVEAGGIMRADILTFRRMAYRVFNEVGGIAKSHVNSAGKNMILYRLLEEISDKLQVSGAGVKQPGYISLMSKLISEFKHYNISPELLQKAGESLNEADILKRKLHDLSLVYSSFNEALNIEYSDSDDDLTRLYNKMDESGLFDGAEIWIDEFSGFTPQEYNVIGKLLKKACRVTVTLCADSVSASGTIDVSNIFSPNKCSLFWVHIVLKYNPSLE